MSARSMLNDSRRGSPVRRIVWGDHVQDPTLDAIPHHVWSVRSDGTLSYWNQQLIDYTGCTAEQLRLGSSETLHPEDVARVRDTWRAAFANGTSCEMERRIRGRDGSYRRFLCRGTPVCDEQGRVVEYFGTDTDVEELRRSAEALGAAQADLARMSRIAMMGELAASLAHELNQPLAAIIASGDSLLRWQRASPPNFEQSLLATERIRRDALRASAVVENIRSFLQNAQPEPILVSVPEAIHDVLDMLAFDLEQHRIELQVSAPKNLPPVLVTRVELQQVLVNLLANAIESLAQTAPGQLRRLSIDSACGRRNDAKVVTIVVQDTGLGFEERDRDRLFDAFFTTKPEGLGMGLAISRSIVGRHGGDLEAHNTPDGPRFEFYIPLSGPSGYDDCKSTNGFVELT